MPEIQIVNKEVGRAIGVTAKYIVKLERDFRDCRNELCLKCGNYKQKHIGACDGCRWENIDG